MEENEEQYEEPVEQKKSVIGALAKEGLKLAWKKIPIHWKLWIIGGIAILAFIIIVLIIFLGSGNAKMPSVMDKSSSFQDNQADYPTIEEYNFYKALNDLNNKYGEYLNIPLLLATLLYGEDDAQDKMCNYITGEQALCSSDMGLSYYGFDDQIKVLATNMMTITKSTKNCGTGDTTVQIISPSSVDDILQLSNSSDCSDTVLETDKYSFSMNIDQYDKYLFDTYLQLHPIRYGFPLLIATEKQKNSIITEIHDVAEQYQEYYTGEGSSGTVFSCEQLTSVNVSCNCIPEAKAEFFPSGTLYGGFFSIISEACSGLSGSRFVGTPYNLHPEFASRLTSFIEYVSSMGYYTSIGGGWRSFQQQLACTTSKCASAGFSKHGWGLAADLNLKQYQNNFGGAMVKIHQAAKQFGLTFNLCPDYAGYLQTYSNDDCWQGEYWHIQPQNIQGR